MRLRAQNRIVTGALILLLLLVVAGALVGAPPVRAEGLWQLPARSVPHGLASDHANHRYWLLDKASGRLTLTALSADGAVEGQMTSRDQLTDAQALAYDAGQAFIGDVGGRRKEVVILQVSDPWPGTEINKAPAFRLVYPDGASHEAAAILVDATHRLHVVTTGEGAGIFQAPESPSASEANALTRVASVPDGVTDGTVLLDGRVVLRTASTVLTLDPTTWEVVAEEPLADPDERGHALAEGLGTNQVVTAAGPDGLVAAMPVPGPSPSGTPSPRPTRRTQVPAQPDAPEPTRTFDQTGTTIALIAAAALAVLAGGIVLVRR